MAVLRQVAKTDTFEKQRQVINALAQDLFSIGAGGSDLTTGFLKIGDGSIDAPSLSFLTDESVGFYKPDTKSIGIVSGGKNLFDYKEDGGYLYRDLNLRKRSLLTSGLSITNEGQNYDAGTYSDISVIGGSGVSGSVNITVEAFGGYITSNGSGYKSGSFDQIPLITDGSGTQVLVSFSTPELTATITNAGSGYTPNIYTDVPLNGGTNPAAGAIATLEIGESGSLIAVTFSNFGNYYQAGDVLTVSNADLTYQDTEGDTLTSGGAGIQLTVDSDIDFIDPNTLIFGTKGDGHAVGDQLSLPGQANYTITHPGVVSGISINVTAETSTFTVTSGTAASLQANMLIIDTGGTGLLPDGVGIESIDGTTVTMTSPANGSGAVVVDFQSADLSAVFVATSTANIISGSIYTIGGQEHIITSIDTDNNTLVITPEGVTPANNTIVTILPPWGNGSGFNYYIDKVGVIGEVTVNKPGNGYAENDILTVSSSDLTQPLERFVSVFDGQEVSTASPVPVTVGSTVSFYTPADPDAGTPASYGDPMAVIAITGGTSGSATKFVAESSTTLDDGSQFGINGSGIYTVSSNANAFKYYIGNAEDSTTLVPSLTLFAGNKYFFNQFDGSYSSHPLRFSVHKDGTNNEVIVSSVTISTTSNVLTVSSTTGIEIGMTVSVVGGSGGFVGSPVVTDIIGNDITLSENPSTEGVGDVRFAGAEYTSGVTSSSSGNTITITEDTPSILYYYCPNHPGVGAVGTSYGQLNISLLNPKTFGSDFEVVATSVDEVDQVTFGVVDGTMTALEADITNLTVSDLESTTNITTPLLTATTAEFTSIVGDQNQNLSVSSINNIVFNASNINYGSISLNQSANSITTTGEIKTTDKLNINDVLTVSNNNIATTTGTNIVLKPGSGAFAKVDAVSAIVIPVGDTNGRPGVLVREDGMIRYNTETTQFEGYSTVNGNGTWSSLGGVRDQDGNTYILAELTPGANDNTLWFFNDDVNTLTVNRNYLDFKSVKKIRSSNTSAPAYTDFFANVFVDVGQNIKWKNNIYTVVVAGVVAGPGSEPVDTTGNPFSNGSATLQYVASAVSTVRFEEISEVQFGESCPVSIQGDLRLRNNIISTDVNDLIIRPNTGLKVKIDASSTLVLPVGTEDDRGNAAQGAIRFSTTSSQFEGYDGTNWGSLGGVKDVNQNTYIQPESAPGADEDILYFYNNNSLSLQLTEQRFEFKNVDTVFSENGTLALDAGTLTFNNFRAQLDTTTTTNTKFTTTSDKFELGFNPTGLVNETLLRFTETGEIWYNRALGTGNESYLRILDNDLLIFELEKTRQKSIVVPLERGVVNSGQAELYTPSSHIGTRVHAIAYNKTTGDKETMEFTVIDKGVNIYYYELGNLKTGVNLVTPSFDFAPGGQVRVTFTINTALAQNNLVDVVVISNIIKK